MTRRNIAPAAKAEGIVQIVIMLAIGVAAGAASFTHVHNVAAAHGQNGWLAWADAVVLELMSIASGLELRRRKRLHTTVRFPVLVLVVATALSISAQVVEAQMSVIGWIAAALPALGFLVMVKIALARSDSAAVISASPAVDAVAAEPAAPNTDRVTSSGGDLTTVRQRLGTSEREPTVPEGPRMPSARTDRRRERVAPDARVDSGRAGPKVPVTATALAQWVTTWVNMCTDGTATRGSLNDDDYARDRYQLSAKQLRNIRNAATSGALRRRATELGMPLPANYVDRLPTGNAVLAAA